MPTLGNAIPLKHIYYFVTDVLIHNVLFQAYKIWYPLEKSDMIKLHHTSTKLLISSYLNHLSELVK